MKPSRKDMKVAKARLVVWLWQADCDDGVNDAVAGAGAALRRRLATQLLRELGVDYAEAATLADNDTTPE